MPQEMGEYYRRWRVVIFDLTPDMVQVSSSEADTVYGVILDVGMRDRRTSVEFAISMTAFPTGEASFHPTPGSSIVGLGNHPPIAQIAKQIVQAAQKLWHITSPTRDRSLPRAGLVRFFFLTTSGVRLFEGTLQEVQTPTHPFGELLGLGTGQDLGDVAFQLRGAQVTEFDRQQVAVHTEHRRDADGQMNIGATLLRAEF